MIPNCKSDLTNIARIRAIRGVRLSSVNADLYGEDRDDLALIELAEGTVCAAVFTKNLFPAAPVSIAKKHLKCGNPSYLLINAANANAATGEQGINDCLKTCSVLAEYTDKNTVDMLPFSTGVIGESFPVEKICDNIPRLLASLKKNTWRNVAQAIMTTDTCVKAVSRQAVIGGEIITVTGIAKGSGMIHPNMGTMLAFIGSDVAVSDVILQQLSVEAVKKSFNCISVDGDTSTNDACIFFSTSHANHYPIISNSDPMLEIFSMLLDQVCLMLAKQIVMDGEGATRLVSLEVTGGYCATEVRQVANSVATSPLVKTMIYAGDPNWGRILAAVGKVPLSEAYSNTVSIYIGEEQVVAEGQIAPGYSEERVRQVMAEAEISIRINLASGKESTTVLFCDLSPEYVKINAEYRS